MRKTQLRITKTKVRRGKQWERYYCVIVPKLGGGRTRRFFKFTDDGKKEADTFLEISKTQQQNFGTAALSLSDAQRAEYIQCCEAVQPYGLTLRAALDLILPQLKARNRSCTAKELIAELLRVKTADGASARYLSDLQSRLNQFAACYGDRPVSSISGTEIDAWLRTLPVSPTSRNNSRRILIVAFNFAVQHGYCVSNAAEQAAKARQIEKPPGILTPGDLARLLESCDEELVPLVAIGAFGGLRMAELARLNWSEIDLQGGYIEVTAEKAKSARRRLVKIQDNLAEWLRPRAKQSGLVEPMNCRKLLDKARRDIGFGTPGTETDEEKAKGIKLTPWPHNALRHSFASYHLAHFKDAAALALEMGHTNSNLVFQHYRELVKPKAAERYWNILPAREDIVVAMAS